MWTEDMTVTADFVDDFWDKKAQTFHFDRSRDAQRASLIRRVLVDSGIVVRHTVQEDDGYESYYNTGTIFTEESTSHLLESAALYEGCTSDLGNGNAFKTGLTLVKTCLEATGISVESHRTRKDDGTQVREYRPSVMDMGVMEGTYFSESKYPWNRVCQHNLLVRSFGHKGEVNDAMRDALLRVWQRGNKRGYYKGSRYFV